MSLSINGGWRGVTWYSKLITAALLVGLYVFGVYVGQQYAEATRFLPATVYTGQHSKEIPVLMSPIVLTVSGAQTAADKKNSTPGGSAAKTTTTHTTSSTPAPAPAVVAPAIVTTPQPVVIPPVVAQVPVTPVPPVVVTQPPVVPLTPPATSTSSTTPVTPPAPTAGEIRFTAYTTGYGWPDNTPPSAEISNPVIHQTAGGTGTYADPITVAVGHTISGNTDTLDYPEGTEFYLPNLRRYFIVEDTCGDGNKPQNGPCHTGFEGHVWLDLWIGGTGSNSAPVLSCEDDITDLHLIIQNPSPNYAVVPGPVYGTSCSAQYGDTVVSS